MGSHLHGVFRRIIEVCRFGFFDPAESTESITGGIWGGKGSFLFFLFSSTGRVFPITSVLPFKIRYTDVR